MATTIKLKNSVTTTNAPSSLVQGEVAINITDKKVWVGNAATTPIQLLGAGASGTFGALTCTSLTNSGLTSGRVTYATTAGLLTDSANLTFNGTTLTANTIGAFTLGGTISGGGNQINNVIIGNSNPLAGSFTTLSASGVATISAGTVSAPALTTTGDTNTGIFFPAADTIAFTEGGVEAMRINSSGNVLIGATTLEGSVTTGAVKYLVLSGGYASNPQQIGMTMLGGADGAVGHFTFSGQSSGGNPRLVASISGYQTGTTVSVAAGYLAFNTNVGTAEQPTERMRITSTGNVGIGTSSPSSPLHVMGTDGTEQFKVGSLTGGTNFNISVVENDKVTLNAAESTTSRNMVFATGGTERMRIDSSGNVSIGTSTGNPLGNGGTVTTLAVASSGAGALSLVSSDTADGSVVGALNFGTTGASTNKTTAAINVYLEGSGATNASGNMRFFTRSGTDFLERMRITSGGQLLVGTSGTMDMGFGTQLLTSRSTSGTAAILQCAAGVNEPSMIITNASSSGFTTQIIDMRTVMASGTGFKAFNYASDSTTTRFFVRGDGNCYNTNGTYGTISDAKLKENIVDATPKLNKINQLKVRNYNFIGEELNQIGFVAQEFEQIFPTLVDETIDRDEKGNDLGTTTKTIKTTVLIPILVKAIQEQQAMIEELKQEVAKLKGV